MREVTVDGARLAYREAGPAGGEPVVMLHGYPSNHRVWRHQIEALEGEFRVLGLDSLGWGDSDRPLELAFDYETEVARLGRALDALGLDRCTLVGHDYGGFLALGFTEDHPDRVQRLAVLNSRSHRTFVLRWYLTFGSFSLIGRTPGLRSLAARLPIAELNRRGLAQLVTKRAIDRELLENYVGWLDSREGRRWLLHFFGEYRVGARKALGRRLGEISCPTAVIWGARDVYLSTTVAEELAAGIPGAKLTLVPDAGHFVTEERPEAVNQALRELLAR